MILGNSIRQPAISIRIPEPLRERARNAVAAIPGETLSSIMIRGLSFQVKRLETLNNGKDADGNPIPFPKREGELQRGVPKRDTK